MSLEKWVEYGWLRREPTSTGEIKDLLGIVERSLADAKVGPYRPISLHSTPRSASLRLRSEHPVIAPQPKRVTTLRQSRHWNYYKGQS
jgi:hypothetical protein